MTEYGGMIGQYEKLVAALARTDGDISLRQAVTEVAQNRWTPIAEYWCFGVFGIEPDQVSTVDWLTAQYGEDFHCPAGYGALVAHFGRDVPVELNTAVTAIDWSGQGVRVSTTKDTISAKHCAVTVSVSVLQAGAIRFTPRLPDWKQTAIGAFNMSDYITIGLKFRRPGVLPVTDNALFWVNGDAHEMFLFMSNLGGKGVTRASASGTMARDLERAGPRVAVDLALERLRHALGSSLGAEFEKESLSDWTDNPRTMGAWAWAKPGEASQRGALRQSVGERIFFAGEACHETIFATCHGALLSGTEIGERLAETIQ